MSYFVIALSFAAAWSVLTSVGHEQECTLRGHSAAVNSVAFSPDGTRVVSASGKPGKNDNTVRIWDIASCKEVGASGPGHARY